uniref:Uncharacterized protein n=1 Tax=Arundo donax TaxID=35708 RepID=A0A0A9CL11_ARUDO
MNNTSQSNPSFHASPSSPI